MLGNRPEFAHSPFNPSRFKARVDNPLIFGFALGPGETVGEGGVLGALSARVKITTLTDAVTYCLKKNDLTPVLKQNPDVARLRCQLVTQRQQTLKKIGAPTPAGHSEQSLFQWRRRRT